MFISLSVFLILEHSSLRWGREKEKEKEIKAKNRKNMKLGPLKPYYKISD